MVPLGSDRAVSVYLLKLQAFTDEVHVIRSGGRGEPTGPIGYISRTGVRSSVPQPQDHLPLPVETHGGPCLRRRSSAIPDSVTTTPSHASASSTARVPARSRTVRRTTVSVGVLACAGLVAFVRPSSPATAMSRASARSATTAALRAARVTPAAPAAHGAGAPFPGLDSLRGASRKLRARFLSPGRAAGLTVLRELFGDSAVSRAGVYAAGDSSGEYRRERGERGVSE